MCLAILAHPSGTHGHHGSIHAHLEFHSSGQDYISYNDRSLLRLAGVASFVTDYLTVLAAGLVAAGLGKQLVLGMDKPNQTAC